MNQTRLSLKFFLKTFYISMCTYAATDFCLPQEIIDHTRSLYGSKYIYLTNICLYMTLLCLYIRLLTRFHKSVLMKRFYRNLLCVTLPLDGLVSILFWSFYLNDPTLLRNKELYDKNIRISLFTDFCTHLLPFLSLLVEQQDILVKRHNFHLFFYLIFSVSYYMIAHVFNILNGEWVYPILGKLSLSERVCFFGISTLIVICLYEGMMYILEKKVAK